MARKKWTALTEVTEPLLRTRNQRKWQIALRRYVLGQSIGATYAPYFGLDIKSFRNWIELQFDEVMNWENFSRNWQFDHVIPVTLFDFDNEEDLKLCWNFVNIRAEKIDRGKVRNGRMEAISAKSYFESLFNKTGYVVCSRMIAKIDLIAQPESKKILPLESFINENQELISTLSSFNAEELSRINTGASITNILDERAFIKKYG